MSKTAIILGATGLTGNLLLNKVLNNEAYSKVIVFSRSELSETHEKLQVKIINLLQLIDYKSHFMADVVFCCIGTTKAKTPDESVYKSIDYGIPVAAAKLCKANNIETFIVVSALGANADSRFFYNRIKGEMERDVLKLHIKNTYILQPSLIEGQRNERRIFEWFWQKLMVVVNVLLIGWLKKYRSIKAGTIANAMVILDLKGYKQHTIESNHIKKIANA